MRLRDKTGAFKSALFICLHAVRSPIGVHLIYAFTQRYEHTSYGKAHSDQAWEKRSGVEVIIAVKLDLTLTLFHVMVTSAQFKESQ